MAERADSDDGDELFAVQLDHVERPVRRLFLAYGRGRLGFIGVGIVMTVVAPVLELLPAYLLGVVVDAVFLQTKAYALPGVPSGWIPPGRRGQLYFSAGLIAGVMTLHWVVDWIHN
jgi:ATP-binding cassette subfamily B protein